MFAWQLPSGLRASTRPTLPGNPRRPDLLHDSTPGPVDRGHAREPADSVIRFCTDPTRIRAGAGVGANSTEHVQRPRWCDQRGYSKDPGDAADRRTAGRERVARGSDADGLLAVPAG